jgi:hypothetical protein
MTARDRSGRTDDPPALRAKRVARLRVPSGGSTLYNLADQFSKSLLRDTLSCAAATTPGTEVEVTAATQKIDVYAVPDPTRTAERERMGLLGELFRAPCLFEPFRNTPSLPLIRRALCKQLTWHHELERRALVAARAAARAAGRAAPNIRAVEPGAGAPEIVPFPWLVVISQGRPNTVIEVYGCKRVSPGVYEAAPGLQMRVIVLAELPRTRETLLLRLLGAGPILAAALDDFGALPEDAWEKSAVTPVLVQFGRARPRKLETNEEEADVRTEIQAWFDDYQRELRTKERGEGRVEEASRSVLTVLRVRGVAVPDVARERILAQKEPSLLERWLERASIATSIAEVIDDPS